MKGFRRAVLPLCVVLVFLAHAAKAQTNTHTPSGRKYDSRIQMHTAPVTLLVPDNSLETQKGAPESTDRGMMTPRETMLPSDVMLPSDIPQESQIRPNGPRLRDRQEKKQNKNWLLPSSAETRNKDEETTSKQKEEVDSSGWGWLADDVQARQQKQKKDDQKNSDSREKDKKGQPQSDRQKEDVKPKTDGILLDTAFKPVSSSTSTKDDEEDKAEDTSARDETPEEKKNRADGPTTMESPRNRSAADQPREQKFGADATWGNESLWSKNAKPVSAMPQTEALLSTSKLDAKKPIEGLDRLGFKPDAQAGAIHRVEPDQPEPERRNFVAAASFQPLPAAPVNDLGNTPWAAGDTPGGTPFAGSTAFSPEPVVTPSQPVESPRALTLPTPVASPWLR